MIYHSKEKHKCNYYPIFTIEKTKRGVIQHPVTVRLAPWFKSTCYRLLHGKIDVHALLVMAGLVAHDGIVPGRQVELQVL